MLLSISVATKSLRFKKLLKNVVRCFPFFGGMDTKHFWGCVSFGGKLWQDVAGFFRDFFWKGGMDIKHFWTCVSKEKENQKMTKDKQIEVCKCRTERTRLSGTSCETELAMNLWADLTPSDAIQKP